jgi:non-ribosomal peptide synthetase component F
MLALDYVAGDPSRHLAGLALVTEAERRYLLEDWKTPPMVLPWEPLHRLFLTTAAVRPDAVALLQAGRQTSYRELAVRAEGVAALLLRQGLEPEELVAVCLPPGPALPAALFGVLLAGGALLPMDPQTPPERLDWIVRHARVRWAIADDRERGLFPSDQVRVLSVEPPPQGVPPPARFPLVALADLA